MAFNTSHLVPTKSAGKARLRDSWWVRFPAPRVVQVLEYGKSNESDIKRRRLVVPFVFPGETGMR